MIILSRNISNVKIMDTDFTDDTVSIVESRIRRKRTLFVDKLNVLHQLNHKNYILE